LKYNIPVSFNACGYGPNNQRSISLFKWIIEQPCISQITTRDNIASLTKKDIKVIPDAAIMAYHYYDFKPYNKQEQIIGINIIAPAYYIDCSNDKISYEDFNKKMIAILKELSKTYKILLFSNGDINDQLYAAWLYNKVQDLNVAIEERPTNGFELIKIIYKLSLVIGFRLHSLITAYSYDIPAIGIAWDNKLNYWGKMTENKNIYVLSEFPIINIGELSGELIKKGIDKKKKVALESEIIEQIKTYI
jgi:polysaccharide pyruvyl transferase WcaK-like protein